MIHELDGRGEGHEMWRHKGDGARLPSRKSQGPGRGPNNCHSVAGWVHVALFGTVLPLELKVLLGL